MPHRKIANWTTIRNMCRCRFAAQTAEELEMQAVELARQHAEDEVAAFEREGEVAQAAMVRVLENASAVAADVAVGKMHATVARKAVEAVPMEAAMAALCAMRNDPAMVSLEAMAMEATKVAVPELHDGIVTHQASVEAQMYGDDAEDEESHVGVMAMVATGTMVWLLVDGDETEVEDEDDEEEAEATQRDAELHAAEVRVKAVAEAERVSAVEATEQATHWAAEMDKALAYRRDVDRNTAAWQDVVRRAETEQEAARCADTGHRIERCMTVPRQEDTISAAISAIEAAGVGGNGDRGTLQ
jgi:hypothetical protein